MSTPRASLLGLPVELRYRIYEHVLSCHRDEDGTAILSFNTKVVCNAAHYSYHILDDRSNLQRSCRTVSGEVIRLLRSAPKDSKSNYQFYGFNTGSLQSWLHTFDDDRLFHLQSLDCKMMDQCSFVGEARTSAHASGFDIGEGVRSICPGEPRECHHECRRYSQTVWQRADMKSLLKTGICRIEIDLKRLRQDVAGDTVSTSAIIMPKQSFEPYLMEAGYVRAYYCGDEATHLFMCARTQAATLRKFIPRLVPDGDCYRIRKDALLKLCKFDGKASVDGELTLPNGNLQSSSITKYGAPGCGSIRILV